MGHTSADFAASNKAFFANEPDNSTSDQYNPCNDEQRYLGVRLFGSDHRRMLGASLPDKFCGGSGFGFAGSLDVA